MSASPKQCRARRHLAILLSAIGLIALVAWFRGGSPSPAEPAPEVPQPLAGAEPARNPVDLVLLTDPARVVGWISGEADREGETVRVRFGDRTEQVRVGQGNTFTWAYTTTKPADAEFIFGDLKKAVTLAPPAPLPPSVFFVTDRHVYRPKQTIHFAAFLRELDAAGEFVPLPGREVEVRLTSRRKKTVAASLKLTADEAGKLVGDYTFSDADPLDTYLLTIPGFRGSTRIDLAEYRKSMARLGIRGKREGDRLTLRFELADTFARPAPGTRVRFTAQLVRNPSSVPDGDGLRGEDFAYARASRGEVPELEDLDEDDRLVLQTDPRHEPNAPGGDDVAAEVEGEAVLTDGMSGQCVLPLPAGRRGRHALVVKATFTDGMGREEHQTRAIALDAEPESLRLRLDRTSVTPGEVVRVRAVDAEGGPLPGGGTLVAMRLSSIPPEFGGRFGGIGAIGQIGAIGGIGQIGQFGGLNGIGGPRMGAPRWRTAGGEGSVRRSLATATPFKQGTATLKLAEPGPYKLLAIWERPDGGEWRREIGCVVQDHGDQPALTLEVARVRLAPGEPLAGVVRSRFAGARVLLTVRDSRGYRLCKTLRLENGAATIYEPLPADLRYGCAVEVQYADSPGPKGAVHLASQMIHVEPTGRILKVETKMKPVVAPGETVAIDLQVNRAEAVDLIVSVYDRTLTSLGPDRSTDIRSFYLADDRVRLIQGREALLRRVGHIPLAGLIQRVRGIVQEEDRHRHDRRAEGADEPPSAADYRGLLVRYDDPTPHYLDGGDILLLLRVAGVRARWLPDWHGRQEEWAREEGLFKCRTLGDLLTREPAGFHLYAVMLHDTFLLGCWHPDQLLDSWEVYEERERSRASGAGARFNGLGQIGGIGQIGAIGQIGHIGGMPPQRPAPQRVSVIPTAEPDVPASPVRSYFADSAFWSARVRTDAEGRARVEFKLPDVLTSWQVVVTAISKDLHVGRHAASFKVHKPIMIASAPPRNFVEGDTMRVNAGVANRSGARQELVVKLGMENGEVVGAAVHRAVLDAGEQRNFFWTVRAGSPGTARIFVSADCAGGSDASVKPVPVLRAAPEKVVTASGFCAAPAEFEIPEGIDPASATVEVRFVPTLMADLVDTLDYLVEYPYGCVEQTMSRFLPAIKVAQVLDRMKLDHPRLKARLPACVEGGIKRLLELQQDDGGWGWHGTSSTDQLMTAYALYGLLQAERAGYSIRSEKAIERGLYAVRRHLENRQGGTLTDEVFSMYVFAHRGRVPAKWWERIDAALGEDRLSDYALAMALELAVRRQEGARAARLADRLRARTKQRGGDTAWWETAGFSHWADDRFEVTAAALKALVAFDRDDPLIPRVLAFFAETKRGDRWNSTKDTALIVFAVCDYLALQDARGNTPARLTFRCNDGPAREVAFAQSARAEKVVLPSGQLRAGVNRLTFSGGGEGTMYRLVLRYRGAGRRCDPVDHGIFVERSFYLLGEGDRRLREIKPGDAVPVGSYVESAVVAVNGARESMRFVLMENPRPAGCEVMPEDDARFGLVAKSTWYVLREDREAHVAYHYQAMPSQLHESCVLRVEAPGEFLVPPARVEMMYRTQTWGHSGTFAFRAVEQAARHRE